jgi:hypothetical protein
MMVEAEHEADVQRFTQSLTNPAFLNRRLISVSLRYR